MTTKVLLVTSALVLLFALVVHGEPSFGGANVCNKTITVRKDKTVAEPVKYELQYSGICGILPCTKTRVETRMDYKLKTTLEEIDVAVCCPGYAETPNRQCAPICLKPCNYGTCVAPGQCKCNQEPTETSPGFVGSSCNRYTCLASNRWGYKCEKECNCSPNSYCSANTGKCICRSGWRGANCTEECDSTMNCDDVELPPIIEPDANVISDSAIQSQKLESIAPRALLRDFEIADDSSSSNAGYNFNVFNMSMNLFLLTLVAFLVFAIWRVKNRLNMIRNEVYYGPSSAPSSTYASQSYYSNGSNGTSVQNRPRMPTPPEAGLLGKNLSFDAATRYILLSGDSKAPIKASDDIQAGSKVEVHLITSQEASKQNHYSDIDQTINNRSYDQRFSNTFTKPVLDDQMLRINTTDPTSHYQVPKSPAIRASPLENVSSQSSNDKEQQTSGIYENGEQNLYEEIKPKSPYKEL